MLMITMIQVYEKGLFYLMLMCVLTVELAEEGSSCTGIGFRAFKLMLTNKKVWTNKLSRLGSFQRTPQLLSKYVRIVDLYHECICKL